jgi:hypothetical protein
MMLTPMGSGTLCTSEHAPPPLLQRSASQLAPFLPGLVCLIWECIWCCCRARKRDDSDDMEDEDGGEKEDGGEGGGRRRRSDDSSEEGALGSGVFLYCCFVPACLPARR